MVIRYFDKDGKEHKLNIKSDYAVWICSKVENTGDWTEVRVQERKKFNCETKEYETCGQFDIAAANPSMDSLAVAYSNRGLILGSMEI